MKWMQQHDQRHTVAMLKACAAHHLHHGAMCDPWRLPSLPVASDDGHEWPSIKSFTEGKMAPQLSKAVTHTYAILFYKFRTSEGIPQNSQQGQSGSVIRRSGDSIRHESGVSSSGVVHQEVSGMGLNMVPNVAIYLVFIII